MSPWDVRFDPDNVGHVEPLGDGAVRITVHAEPSLTDGQVVVRAGEGIVSKAMNAVTAGRFSYWTTEIGPYQGPIQLSLTFVTHSGHPLYVVPSGVSSSVERLDRWTIDPTRSALAVPDWVQGAVIYQIFPDRFDNAVRSTDPPDVAAWGSPPESRVFQGGDLRGVTRRLDHLESLGVDALYLNPIFASPSNHRYDTIDYLSVDPSLGGDAAFRDLIDQAHHRDIRIILDASFNHVHPRFFAFQDLIKNGQQSIYRDWFVVNEWPLRIRHRLGTGSDRQGTDDWLQTWMEQTGLPFEPATDAGPPVEPTYEAWYGVPTMPRLALENHETREFALSVARYWLKEFAIDGWRMDVARYVDPDFWPEFRSACRSVNPDAYLLAEIMGDASPWLQGDAFDGTMNYTFRDIALGFFARDELDGHAVVDHLTRLQHRHPRQVGLANQNLLGSHDTTRFLTESQGEAWRLRLATVFQLLFPGAPGLYYGDEIALEGENDPGCRGAFLWERLGGSSDFTATIGQLTRLRRERPELRLGGWHPLGSTPDAFLFERSIRGQTTVAGLNRGTEEATLAFQGGVRRIWGSGHATAGSVSIDPRSAAIFTT